jgi:hypothetical protein
LHLIATPAGLSMTLALSNAKVDERDVAVELFDSDTALLTGSCGQIVSGTILNVDE